MSLTTALTAALGDQAAALNLQVHARLDSTQTVLAQQVAQGARVPALLVAQAQTAGIGRHGKAFASPETGLYFTYACPAPATPLVTPAAGVAMQAAIAAVTGRATTIKWVNDLLLNDAKCVGILATQVQSPQGPVVLIGCGVNLQPVVQSPVVPDALPIAALYTEPPAPNVRADLVASWLRTFTALLAAPATIMPAYRQHAAWVGRRIRVRPGHRELVGILQGFDDAGALILATAAGPQTITTGSIRLA